MSILPAGKTVRRETMVAMLRAALDSGELRFARQAALAWLAAFPGDLEVTLLQAQALIADGKPGQVVPMLEALYCKDPFDMDAYRALASAVQSSDPDRYTFAITALYALGAPVSEMGRVETWGESLRQAFNAYAAKDYGLAEVRVQEALRIQPDLLIAAALHLLVDRATQEPLTIYHLAQIYHSRWPECLPVSLVLAESQLDMGNEPEAVHLLHLCAAGDATGQVARRLWGDAHPYRSLWPNDMVILFDQPIPAGVAGQMGWNRLAPGEILVAEPVAEPQNPAESGASTDAAGQQPENAAQAPAEPSQPGQDTTTEKPEQPVIPDSLPFNEQPMLDAAADPAAQAANSDEAATNAEIAASEAEAAGADPSQTAGSSSTAKSRRKPVRMDIEGTAQSVGVELERLAKRIKQPVLGRVDGRFPVYVIFTSLEGLINQYGPQTTTVLQNEMRKVAAAVDQKPGWSAMVYYPDDAACTGQYGLTPVNPSDPWKLKNALCDLDVALRQRGEMIGALLIVGNETVVPFHRLPNPTDDSDSEVFSDSPYATLDANYFAPEWPVGRLPGEKGPDAALLLDQIHSVQRYHTRRHNNKIRPVLGLEWLAWVGSLVERFLPPRSVPSFGYTAAVWRRSSLAVFRPVGAPHTVKASPPDHSGSVDRDKITLASLGYYNLHGLEDASAWYGQRDPMEPEEGPDYPVALVPEDLHRNGHAPRVIFSEACYGAHIFNKSEKESLALKFLSMGTLAVVGSTCTAYGSVNTPLIAADLLGHMFWQHLKMGRTAGEALMQAKLDLVREMNRRQGYLDGEDQKTLITFVLFGDPLAGYDGFHAQRKAAYRMKTHPLVKTVSDNPDENIPTAKVDGEVLKEVKKIVAEYLPGAEMAEMHFTRQEIPVTARHGSDSRKKSIPGSSRMVVMVSKQVEDAGHLHQHYMRVTLDEEGKPIKLSISR